VNLHRIVTPIGRRGAILGTSEHECQENWWSNIERDEPELAKPLRDDERQFEARV